MVAVCRRGGNDLRVENRTKFCTLGVHLRATVPGPLLPWPLRVVGDLVTWQTHPRMNDRSVHNCTCTALDAVYSRVYVYLAANRLESRCEFIISTKKTPRGNSARSLVHTTASMSLNVKNVLKQI